MGRQSGPNDDRYDNAGLSPPSEFGAGATTRPRRVAFVLSGGGSLGSIQVGALEALLERGVYPDVIVGTSVGALNGALLAREPTLDGVHGIRDIWLSLERGAVFTGGRRLAFFRLLFGMDHLYTNKGLRRLVTRNLGPITFADLSLPFLATATDVEEGTVRVFDTGPLLPALLASSAIPDQGGTRTPAGRWADRRSQARRQGQEAAQGLRLLPSARTMNKLRKPAPSRSGVACPIRLVVN